MIKLKKRKLLLSVTAFMLLTSLLSCKKDDDDDDSSYSSKSAEKSWASEKIPSDYSVDSDFWDNASVYFVLTDRFYNGNTGNDTSYGREKGSATKKEDAGKFFGGDIKGLTEKLDYLEDLGVNAIWITAPYEQIHGWCVGGSEEFKHYPYHGYYALDYTNVDANVGTKEEFRSFVDAAHAKDIRVIMDVVMNHPGYNTIEDAYHLYPKVLKSSFDYETSSVTLSNYHDYIKYGADYHGWDAWWGGSWIRAGLCSHYTTGSGDLTGSAGGSLPDFITEGTSAVSLPEFLKTKHTSEMADYYPTDGYEVVKFEEKSGYTVRDYLIYWLSSWVREFGIDGFRCDTAKHVEKEAWYQLKVACVQALRDWKEANPSKVIADSGDFWMTGEHFGHGVTKDDYFTDGGFNSMINFTFREKAKDAVEMPSEIDSVYSDYAKKINSDAAFNVLSYISSHDTGSQDQKGLFYGAYADSADEQKMAGSLLSMCPGAIQIYYGDEAGRKDSSVASFSGDSDQKNRSQMPWASGEDGYDSALSYAFDSGIHEHWKKMLNFRKNHPAIGAGNHTKLSVDNGYAFSRVKDSDKVVVVLGATTGTLEVDVSSIGASSVKDAYAGSTVSVTDGKASFSVGSSGVLLIEAAD